MSLTPRHRASLANWEAEEARKFPFRSIALRYDYRWCTLWERDASNVMHHPYPFHLFPSSWKIRGIVKILFISENVLLFEHRQRLFAISNRLEDDRFVSRIRMEIGEKEKLERMKLGCTLRSVSNQSRTRERVSMHLATARRAANGQLVHPLETVKFPF